MMSDHEVVRAAVLQLVADAETPPNVAKLSAASGYPRPTVHRIVAALQAEGLIVGTGTGNTFGLGPRLVNLASRSWERSDLRLAAVDALMELRNTTSETIHLAVPSQGEMVYIEKLESPHAVRMDFRALTLDIERARGGTRHAGRRYAVADPSIGMARVHLRGSRDRPSS
ncbi:hypothetical protein LMG28614_02628 [Paraburkholderia ultramafica]|uniref:IclR-ED domain-containing protein n=1 Tax=Paraburkholderia ultramafica TaxID=1544867 RepID=A0A6S7B4T3_9BURK|nr:hypothetical protein LMG28614_02628 [Paraburkholderia ultramafica]